MGLKQFVSACLRVCRAGILVSCLVSGLAWLVHTDAHPSGRSTLAANGSLPGTKANQQGQARLVETYGKLPLSFEANRGQTDARVRFLSRGRGYSLFLTSDEAVMVLRDAAPAKPVARGPRTVSRRAPSRGKPARQSVLRMRLLGADPNPAIAGLGALP